MTLADALLEFRFAKDHSPASRRWYTARLGAFITWAGQQGVTDLESITAPLVRRYIDARRTTPSARTGQLLDSHTLHGHVRAIRAFLHWAAAEELLDEKVPRRVALPKKEQKVLPVLSPQQVERLFLACDSSETPAYVARNKALLAVLLDTGIRATELCSLELADVHLTAEDAYLLVRKGKGRKQRELPLGRKARQLLARYLHRYRPTAACGPHGQRTQAVFVAKSGGALTSFGLDQVIERLMARVGDEHFAGMKRGPHVFRHTFAVRFLEANGDIYRLSRLMGHASVQTTESYLRSFTSRQARQYAISPLDSL